MIIIVLPAVAGYELTSRENLALVTRLNRDLTQTLPYSMSSFILIVLSSKPTMAKPTF